jgi:hypothetical protein
LTSIALLIGIGDLSDGYYIVFCHCIRNHKKNRKGRGGPEISNQDSQLMKIETVADGLSFPTSMEFIDN